MINRKFSNFALQLFSLEKSDIISVKRKIQYSLYFPKLPIVTSLNNYIKLNMNNSQQPRIKQDRGGELKSKGSCSALNNGFPADMEKK